MKEGYSKMLQEKYQKEIKKSLENGKFNCDELVRMLKCAVSLSNIDNLESIMNTVGLKLSDIKIEEITHSIGNRYKHPPHDAIYVLSQVEESRVTLIDILAGNRWNNPVYVESTSKISESEFKKICGSGEFRKIA